jgi:hypothetical protein
MMDQSSSETSKMPTGIVPASVREIAWGAFLGHGRHVLQQENLSFDIFIAHLQSPYPPANFQW